MRGHTNITRRGARYYYRARLPIRLARKLRRNEITRALGTSDPVTARRRARLVSAAIDETKALVDRIDPAQIDELLREWIDESLAQDGGEWPSANGYQITDRLLDDKEDDLAQGDLSSATPRADELIARHSLPLRKGTQEYRAFCRRVLRAEIELLALEKAQIQERSVIHPRLKPSLSTPQAPPKVSPTQPVSHVIEKYAAERSPQWTGKTGVQIAATFRIMHEVIGDPPIGEVEKADIRRVKEALQKRPARAKAGSKEAQRGLAAATVNRHIIALSTFFRWAVDNGYCQVNPAERLTVRKTKRPDAQRPAMTTDEIRTLFTSPAYCGCASHNRRSKPGELIIRDALYWVPLLSAYAGLRMAEALHLTANDVQVIDGLTCIEIRPSQGHKLKSVAGARTIPLHPVLHRLGFLDHASTHGDLFPEIERSGPDLSKSYRFTKRFANYRKAIGITREGVVFHSLRSSFITALKHSGAQEALVAELAGHEVPGQSFGRYGKRYPPRALIRPIEKVGFGLSWD